MRMNDYRILFNLYIFIIDTEVYPSHINTFIIKHCYILISENTFNITLYRRNCVPICVLKIDNCINLLKFYIEVSIPIPT